uniref:Uncharacterized protein n=1 Tax=Timema genevievae TaxID=629358 RepID=A0A7R9JZM8_TIMGE|nr:unnamed protein product [Timema genevievae]
MSDSMDPGKMKVVELRAELSSRGLDSKGIKAVLVDRLREAIAKETGQDIRETSILETSTEDSYIENESFSPSKRRSFEKDHSDEDDDESNSHKHKKPKLEGEVKSELNSQSIKEEPHQDYPSGIDANVTDDSLRNDKTQIKQEEQQDQAKLKDEKEDVESETKVKQEGKENTQIAVKEEHDRRDRDDKRGEKRRHSPSPKRRSTPPRKLDDEPEFDETAVLLDDSDLNLVIDKDNFTTATPMHEQGFGYVWAGARATFGFTTGKVCFEVKVVENLNVSHLEDEPNPHVLRVGWSVDSTSMQLGEEPLSYGYGGTGKASTDCKFKDYGKPFTEGDVVGAYLDLDSSPIIMSFTVNGEPQGVAYEIAHSQLEGKPLFPHILTKNSKFECNFSGNNPWFNALPGYTFVGDYPLEQRHAGAKRPEKREECEMIMMCGLPGCGKTTWANEWYNQHLDTKYNILGTNNLIDKMKMMGLPRKRNYAGRWDVLIDKCTKCLVKLLDVAARRRRNYILDQADIRVLLPEMKWTYNEDVKGENPKNNGGDEGLWKKTTRKRWEE